MKQKILSLLLVIVLLISILPVNAAAASSTLVAQGAEFIKRTDGVWFWPLAKESYYLFTDWAGCCGPYYCVWHRDTKHGPDASDPSVGYTCHTDPNGHNGADIGLYGDKAVYAMADGTAYPYWSTGARGYYVVIEHKIGNGWSYYSYYQHLESINMSASKEVKAGDPIGVGGSTGVSTGPHLHLGLVLGPSGQPGNIGALESTWVVEEGLKAGAILTNPALNSPAGKPGGGAITNVLLHAGSVMYTFDKSEVAIGDGSGKATSGYFEECQSGIYPSYGTVEIAEGCNLYSLPCNSDTAAGFGYESKGEVWLNAGKTVTVTGIIKNSEEHYWYRVPWEGYSEPLWLYSKRVTEPMTQITPRVSGSILADTISGSTYLSGEVDAGGALINTVRAVVKNSSGAEKLSSDTHSGVNASKYKLENNTVDTTLMFQELADGNYTLYIEVTTTNHYLDKDYKLQKFDTTKVHIAGTDVFTMDKNGDGNPGGSSSIYTVSLFPNGANVANSTVKVLAGQPIGELPSYYIENYTFEGWYTAPYGGTVVTADTVPTGNMNIYAHYSHAVYINKLTFNANGGTIPGPYLNLTLDGFNRFRDGNELIIYNVGTQSTQNIYGSEVAVDASGKVVGYRPYGSETLLSIPSGGFILSGQLGWDATTSTHTGGGLYVDQLINLYKNSADVYVRIDFETGSVKAFDSFAGFLADAKYAQEMVYLGALPVPTRPGYIFKGWKTSDGYDTTYYSGFNGYSQVAEWTTESNLYPQDTMVYNGHQYERFDAIVTWTQAKAICEARGGHLVTITDAAEQSAVLDFITQGTRGVYYLGASDAAKEGTWTWVTGEAFSYNNWDKDGEPNGGTQENYAIIMAREQPIYKQVGEWVDSRSENYIAAAYDLSNTGFICEYDTVDMTGAELTVTFNANGGSCSTGTKKVVYDNAIGTLPTPTRSGHKFLGWFTAASGGSQVSEATVVTATMTVYAQWEEAANTLTLIGASGEEWYTENFSGSFTLPEDYPKLQGHYFSCWGYLVGDKGYWAYPGQTIEAEEDVTLTPMWIVHEDVFSDNEWYSSIYNIEDVDTTGYTVDVIDSETDTITRIGRWTDWSAYSDQVITATDTVQVRTKTIYRYYYFLCHGCGDHNPFNTPCGCGSSSYTFYLKWSEIPFSQTNYSIVPYNQDYTVKCVTTSIDNTGEWYFDHHNLNHSEPGTYDYKHTAQVIATGYSSRTYSDEVETAKRTVPIYRLTKNVIADEVIVTIRENSGAYVYDGSEKTVTGYTVAISNSLYSEADFEFTGDDTIRGTDAGYYEMELTPDDFTNTNDSFTNVTFVIEDGSMEIARRQLTLTSASDSKQYDGTALTNHNVTESGFVPGEGASYEFTGSQTDVGSSDNDFTYTLDVGTSPGNYDITVVYGRLTVTPYSGEVIVTITGEKRIVTYKGTEQVAEGYDVEIDNYRYSQDDFTFTGSAAAKGTRVGTYYMGLTSEMFENSNPNFTNVSFVVEDGHLEICHKNSSVVANSNSKVYDGTALTDSGYTVSGLAEGDTVASVTVTGSITEVGTVRNVPSNIRILDENGMDVTSSYTFTCVSGTLEITAKSLTITADSDSKEYDGTVLVNSGYTTTELAEGDSIASVSVSGSVTEVGSTSNIPSNARIVNKNGVDVTSCYMITYVSGTLEVTQNTRNLTVTANSGVWVYDGEYHSDGGYTVTYGDETYYAAAGESVTLSTGDKVTATITAQVKNVADSGRNEIVSLVVENEDHYANVVTMEGTLTIVRRELTITADSDVKEYDGSALIDDGYTVSGLAPGDTVASVTVTGSITDVGTTANIPSDAVIMNGKEDVTANYAITYVNGSLEITEGQSKTIEITVENVGSGTTGAVITPPADGWTEGTNTFTVSCDNACVVAISYDGGATYTRLTATLVGSGYSFTAENVTAETLIGISRMGDSNGDGKITNADITRLRAAYAGKITFDGLQNLAVDVNGDGKISNADVTRLRAAYAGKTTLAW